MSDLFSHPAEAAVRDAKDQLARAIAKMEDPPRGTKRRRAAALELAMRRVLQAERDLDLARLANGQ